MRIGVNAGFGDLIGGVSLDQFQALSLTVVRQDVLTSEYPEVESLASEFARRPIMPLWLMGSDVVPARLPAAEIVNRAMLAQHASVQWGIPYALEVMNEPDLTGWSPQAFGSVVAEVARRCPYATVVSGGISSTSKQGLRYLRDAIPLMPQSVVVGFHSYRSGKPDEPLPGFSTRKEEFDELKAIAAGRRLWNTEIGWSDYEKHGGLIKSWCGRRLTQEEVASNLRREIAINEAHGVEVLVIFQHRDGRGAEEHFGIFDINGVPKRSAFVAQEG